MTSAYTAHCCHSCTAGIAAAQSTPARRCNSGQRPRETRNQKRRTLSAERFQSRDDSGTAWCCSPSSSTTRLRPRTARTVWRHEAGHWCQSRNRPDRSCGYSNPASTETLVRQSSRGALEIATDVAAGAELECGQGNLDRLLHLDIAERHPHPARPWEGNGNGSCRGTRD